MAKSINIDEIEDELIIAETIYNKYNQMIVKCDTKIDSKVVRILKMWGVESVLVYDKEEFIDDSSKKEKELELLKESVLSKLNWKNLNMDEQFIVELVVNYKLSKYE